MSTNTQSENLEIAKITAACKITVAYIESFKEGGAPKNFNFALDAYKATYKVISEASDEATQE